MAAQQPVTCSRCQDHGWTCEQHPEQPWPHDDCIGPGDACPVCNRSDPTQPPEGFVSFGLGTSAEDPFYAPNRPPVPPAPSTPGELLFEFVRESDRRQFACELRYHGRYDLVETQFFEDGTLLTARMFTTKALAVQWATEERKAIEQGGT